MLFLKVNEVECTFYSPEEMEKLEKEVALGRVFRVMDFEGFGFRISDITGDKVLRAANFDPTKVDLAVPEDWADNWAKVHNGERPNACWSYEDNSIFGEPLFWDTVVSLARCWAGIALKKWLSQQITNATEVLNANT